MSCFSDLFWFQLHALFFPPKTKQHHLRSLSYVMRMPGFTKPGRILVTENKTKTCTYQSGGLVVAPLNFLAVSEDLLHTPKHLLYTFKFNVKFSIPDALSSCIDFFFSFDFLIFPFFRSLVVWVSETLEQYKGETGPCSRVFYLYNGTGAPTQKGPTLG